MRTDVGGFDRIEDDVGRRREAEHIDPLLGRRGGEVDAAAACVADRAVHGEAVDVLDAVFFEHSFDRRLGPGRVETGYDDFFGVRKQGAEDPEAKFFFGTNPMNDVNVVGGWVDRHLAAAFDQPIRG